MDKKLLDVIGDFINELEYDEIDDVAKEILIDALEKGKKYELKNIDVDSLPEPAHYILITAMQGKIDPFLSDILIDMLEGSDFESSRHALDNYLRRKKI